MSNKSLNMVKYLFLQFKKSICMYTSLINDVIKEDIHIVYSRFSYIIHCTTFTTSLLKKAFFITIFSICCLSYGYGKAFAETNPGGNEQQSQNSGPGDNGSNNGASGSSGSSSGSGDSGDSDKNPFEDLYKKLQSRYKATRGEDGDDSDSDDYDDDDDDDDDDNSSNRRSSSSSSNTSSSSSSSSDSSDSDSDSSSSSSGSNSDSSHSSKSSFDKARQHLANFYGTSNPGTSSSSSSSSDSSDSDSDSSSSSSDSDSDSSHSSKSSFDKARQHLANFYGTSNPGTSSSSSSSSDSSDSDSNSSSSSSDSNSSSSSYKNLKRQHKQLRDRYSATVKVYMLSGKNDMLGEVLEDINQKIKAIESKLSATKNTDTDSSSDSDSDSDTDSDNGSEFDFDDDSGSDSDTDSNSDDDDDRDSDDEDSSSSDSDSDSDSDKGEGGDSSGEDSSGEDSSGGDSDNDDHTNRQDPENNTDNDHDRDGDNNQHQHPVESDSKSKDKAEDSDSGYDTDNRKDSESEDENTSSEEGGWREHTVIITGEGNGANNNAPAPGAQPPQGNRAPGNQQPNGQLNGNNQDKKPHGTTTQGYKQAVPKKQTPELEPTPPPGYSVVANKASLKVLMNAIGGVIQETKSSLRMLALQASSARLTPEKPFRVFASVMGGLKKDKRSREGSSQVGVLFTIPQLQLPKLWHGVAYSYGKDQSKIHYGIDTSAVKGFAQSKTDVHHLSFITAWNIAEPGVTGHVEGTIGWGQAKNSRSFTHAGNLTTAKGKTHTHTHGGTARIGYNIPITEHSTLTPYAELASVSANWNPYKESGGTLPAIISKTKQTTLERRIGVKNNWNITNTYKLQTWGAVISGTRQNGNGLSATLPASKIKTSSGKEKKQYTQGELGASLDVKVAKDFGVGLNAGIRTSESKKGLGSGNAGIRLWYDF